MITYKQNAIASHTSKKQGQGIQSRCTTRTNTNNDIFISSLTLVSYSQLLWRVFTQGGIAPVFPFGAGPY
jgi:hypothetical protein